MESSATEYLFQREWIKFKNENSNATIEDVENFCAFIISEKMLFIQENLESYDRDLLLDEEDNRKHIAEVWGVGLSYYRIYCDTFHHICEMYKDYLSNDADLRKKSETYVFFDLNYITGRAIQVASEIRVLLENGFADGAYARSRTLFELWVTADFINQSGENVAQAFLDSTNNQNPKGNYEWARGGLVNKINTSKRIYFSDLIKAGPPAMSKWGKVHNLGHKTIHASPEGTFGRISGEFKNVIPAGASDGGLLPPATNSIILLQNIGQEFFASACDDIGLLWGRFLGMICIKLCEEFDQADKRLFPDR